MLSREGKGRNVELESGGRESRKEGGWNGHGLDAGIGFGA